MVITEVYYQTTADLSVAWHVLDLLCGPRLKIEKRLDRETLRGVHEVCSSAVSVLCKQQSKGSGERTELRNMMNEFSRQLRHILPVANVSASGAPSGLKKALSSTTDHHESNAKRVKVETSDGVAARAVPASALPSAPPPPTRGAAPGKPASGAAHAGGKASSGKRQLPILSLQCCLRMRGLRIWKRWQHGGSISSSGQT